MRRHPWLFEGAVARLDGRARPGDTVSVVSHEGRALGRAAYSPRSQIRAVVLEEPRLTLSSTWAPKSLSYQAALWARELALRSGADEGLRMFADDTVGEGAACNLFWVRAGQVGTPPALGVRPGVTRRRVLELCTRLGLPTEQRPISRGEGVLEQLARGLVDLVDRLLELIHRAVEIRALRAEEVEA